MGLVFLKNLKRICAFVVLASIVSACTPRIRSIFLNDSISTNKSYTVITAKDDGCTNNTLRKSDWTPGLQLLCQTSLPVGIRAGVAYGSTIVESSDGSKNYCWIAHSDRANEGRKVFCDYRGNIIKLNTDALDIPEQALKSKESSLYFFGRKLNSKYVVYRWNEKGITEISGNYNGSGTW